MLRDHLHRLDAVLKNLPKVFLRDPPGYLEVDTRVSGLYDHVVETDGITDLVVRFHVGHHQVLAVTALYPRSLTGLMELLDEVHEDHRLLPCAVVDRKSTRLNSSHVAISYAG